MQSIHDSILDTKPITAITHLKVINEKGQIIIDHKAPLNEWTWSGPIHEKSKAFIYARGETTEISLGDSAVRLEHASNRADQGWGTYFVPRKDGRYTITLDIQEIDANLKFNDFQLVAYGGGWK